MSGWFEGGLFWTMFPLCVASCDHLSVPSTPTLTPAPCRLGFPAVRQLQVSLSGEFYLQLNSAPPPALASSTGSALLSTKQTVNSRFMSWGCETSTKHRPNMFLHEASSEKGGFAPVLQLIARK